MRPSSTFVAITGLLALWLECWGGEVVPWSQQLHVCREAGARVSTNVLVRDLDILPLDRQDGRKLEVVADGLPLGHHHCVAFEGRRDSPPCHRRRCPSCCPESQNEDVPRTYRGCRAGTTRGACDRSRRALFRGDSSVFASVGKSKSKGSTSSPPDPCSSLVAAEVAHNPGMLQGRSGCLLWRSEEDSEVMGPLPPPQRSWWSFVRLLREAGPLLGNLGSSRGAHRSRSHFQFDGDGIVSPVGRIQKKCRLQFVTESSVWRMLCRHWARQNPLWHKVSCSTRSSVGCANDRMSSFHSAFSEPSSTDGGGTGGGARHWTELSRVCPGRAKRWREIRLGAVSSKLGCWRFSSNTTFIQHHFHPKPLSSKTTFILNPKTLNTQTLNPKPENLKPKP